MSVSDRPGRWCDERHLAEVRRKLPPGDEPVPPVPGLPPAPWHWEQVTPEPSRLDPQPGPRGVALVAADGTWVISANSGYGTPEIGGDKRRAPMPASRSSRTTSPALANSFSLMRRLSPDQQA